MDKIIWPSKQRFHNPEVLELNPEDELKIFEIKSFIRLRLIDG